MLKKQQLKSRSACKVTFEVPRDLRARNVTLVGEFNGWDRAATPMRQLKDGRFTVTLELSPKQAYQFRYLVDGSRWDNDWAADRYVPNPFGGDNSVVLT